MLQLARTLDLKAHEQASPDSAYGRPRTDRKLYQARHELDCMDLRAENASLKTKLEKALADLDAAHVSARDRSTDAPADRDGDSSRKKRSSKPARCS